MAALHCLYAGGSIDNDRIALLELERDGFKLRQLCFNLKAEPPSILLNRSGFSSQM
jgi:hypothetical protein